MSMTDCPSEAKQHALNLIVETYQLAQELPVIIRKPKKERLIIAERIREITRELKAFKEKYPDA